MTEDVLILFPVSGAAAMGEKHKELCQSIKKKDSFCILSIKVPLSEDG
jgi:hypothetical protein